MTGEGYLAGVIGHSPRGGAPCRRFTPTGRPFGGAKRWRAHGWPSSAPKSRRFCRCFRSCRPISVGVRHAHLLGHRRLRRSVRSMCDTPPSGAART